MAPDAVSESETAAEIFSNNTAVEESPTEENSNPLLTLQARIVALKAEGVHQFDPVRFHIMEAMLRRALARPVFAEGKVQSVIEGKVAKLLGAYQADFAQAQSAAKISVDKVSARFPQSLEKIKQFFEKYEFRAVASLTRILEATAMQNPIAELRHSLSFSDEDANAAKVADTLQDQAYQQETDLLKSLLGAQINSAQKGEPACAFNQGTIRELKSAQNFREISVKRKASRIVAQTIKAGPENPGPLNAQGLVIRTLSAMRTLSPTYVARLVTQLDTLFWLEQATGEEKRSVSSQKSKK